MFAPTRPTHARLNNFHGTKKKLLGHQAGNAAPSWRDAAPTSSKGKQAVQPGSRIFISNLPPDVVEKEVEELFKKTVGPLKDVFLVYNSQGKSKGMAVVAFVRPGDAAVARMKYNGKIVDGRRPIKIEIVVDADSPSLPQPPALPSLFARLTPPVPQPKGTLLTRSDTTLSVHVAAKASSVQTIASIPIPPKRRVKKGPRRVNKRQTMAFKSKEDLDREMDDYQASKQ